MIYLDPALIRGNMVLPECVGNATEVENKKNYRVCNKKVWIAIDVGSKERSSQASCSKQKRQINGEHKPRLFKT